MMLSPIQMQRNQHKKLKLNYFQSQQKQDKELKVCIIKSIKEMFDKIGIMASQKNLENPNFISRGTSKSLY